MLSRWFDWLIFASALVVVPPFSRKELQEYPELESKELSLFGLTSILHAISVESAYYRPEPGAGIREIFRVLRPGGAARILINYYRDNLHCHRWGPLLAVPTHLLLAEEWGELFRMAGFTDVAHERIVDPSPSPEVYTGRWFRDAAQLREFKAEGALLIHGRKG